MADPSVRNGFCWGEMVSAVPVSAALLEQGFATSTRRMDPGSCLQWWDGRRQQSCCSWHGFIPSALPSAAVEKVGAVFSARAGN